MLIERRSRRASRGVTIVELLIALVILGILTAMALPSFDRMLENARVRGTSDALMSGLQLARAEAIRRNARVRFVLGTQAAWTVELDSDGTDIQVRSAGEGSQNLTVTPTPNNATTVTFNSLGRVVNATPITRLVVDATAKTDNLQIDIASGGQVRLCNQSVTSTSDPRKCP